MPDAGLGEPASAGLLDPGFNRMTERSAGAPIREGNVSRHDEKSGSSRLRRASHPAVHQLKLVADGEPTKVG